MADATPNFFDHHGGTDAPWYQPRDLTDDEREAFRRRSIRSSRAKLVALRSPQAEDYVAHKPVLNPADLMPRARQHLLPALSLFSGGGGLDLGFERAGYAHVGSFDTLDAAGETLRTNRPTWAVHSGDDGDVRGIDWRQYRSELAVLHGGPPCQPFSQAGRQLGHEDARNMLPEFVRAARESRPLAFVCENVPALGGAKFAPYLRTHFLGPLSRDYCITHFRMSAHEFGVPQLRHRLFFVGFRSTRAAHRFRSPSPTHRADHLVRGPEATLGAAEHTLGVRAALGLSDIGIDGLAPTVRSTLTGPRHTTSILSSTTAQRAWAALKVWPNGVAPTRAAAARFPAKNGHFRLAVADVALLQGFPSWWHFHGPVYMSLGQVGNSVAPPIGYRVGLAVAHALNV
jgi:DNA (cytosine-5)-methyltransferase 1